ncbi:hypothetical protein BOX15_Mlig025297g1 [Macrostomum lignano]|uniref:Uncharacterized protein n=2 Tax=Macrostomum lignano TaxID=282301 RepID=A0A267H5Y7_9PLAT|nr:hypothetical protein BOX15_Mlig025297g1 [Macrostomum lignano]
MQGYQQLSSTEHHAAWGVWSTGMMQQQQQHRDAKLAPFESAASVASWSRDRDTSVSNQLPASSTANTNASCNKPARPISLLSPSAPSFNCNYQQSSLMQLGSSKHSSTAGTCTLQHHQLYGDQPHQPGAGLDSSLAYLQVGEHEYLRMQQPVAPVGKQQQNKPGIAHEIDKWIASVTCSAPIPGPGVGAPGPNQIAIDKGTLLNFLTRLKMHYQKKREMRIELCVFCRQNQEPFHVYTSHRLTDAFGNVTCPVLFQYACPICGATGNKAHTIKYCPHGNGNHQSGEQLIDQQPPPPQLGSLQVSRIAGARSSMSISRRG